MQAPRLLVSRLARQSTRNNVRYDHYAPAQSSYNDLPQPQGNWKTHYDANQRKYNAHLALGIGVFVGSILFGKVAGFWEFYNDIPEQPAKIDSYK
ncbi:cytochrome c oxidase subunit 7B [Leptinotarsa decemlineata]|uniref:cytochrome c oxidase subunit 7B n=1 Tax=Leptinotarsa decemlineata TaxID=7539 RepID=UPI003D30B9FF